MPPPIPPTNMIYTAEMGKRADWGGQQGTIGRAGGGSHDDGDPLVNLLSHLEVGHYWKHIEHPVSHGAWAYRLDESTRFRVASGKGNDVGTKR